jgi:hypothetical protein
MTSSYSNYHMRFIDLKYAVTRSTNGEIRPLVEVRDFMKITCRFRGIHGIYLKLVKKNRMLINYAQKAPSILHQIALTWNLHCKCIVLGNDLQFSFVEGIRLNLIKPFILSCLAFHK